MNDHDLLALVERRNQQALIALYDRYSTLVYSIALRLLKSPASAEDVTQELFMRLWNNPERVQVSGETLHGWMMIASRNRSLSMLRKRCPESLSGLILASPSNMEKYAEHRLMCERSFALLSPEQRELLEMAFFGEMTHLEIASATGYPLGTIKSRIRSALKLLRKALTETQEVDPLQPEVPDQLLIVTMQVGEMQEGLTHA